MRFVRSLVCASSLSFALSACTKDQKKAEEPVSPKAEAAPAPAVKPPKAQPMPEEICRVFDKLPSDPPIYLVGKGVVLTRLVKPCVTRDGKRGFEKNTPWFAMGFPCTGGSGRIELKGMYHNPKMISFILGTECGMMPASKDVVDKVVREALQLPKETRLMAYTPFVVQYWEMADVQEAAVGFTIELRSQQAVDGIWRRFKDKNQPVRVKLYGREDSFGPREHFFLVDAELRMTGRNAFQMDVQGVKNMTAEEIAKAKERCEAIRPKQNCEGVF